MNSALDTSPTLAPEVARARRPKWLALLLLAYFGIDPPAALSTNTFIEVLGRFGLSAHAVRSTLSRMVDSNLMRRQRQGRETYYALTPQASRTLWQGNALAWRDIDSGWDGMWTLLAYSIPEDRRDIRHRVRSRLSWGGFGLLRSGVWIAPRTVDVGNLLAGLDVLNEVRVFSSTPSDGTTAADLIKEAYDLNEIADRYRRFIERWTENSATARLEELCAFLLIRSEWQQLVQTDPHLPADYLPEGWPAAEAERLFRSTYLRLEKPATKIAEVFFGRLFVQPQ